MKKWHLKKNPKRQNNKEYAYYEIAENYTDENGKHQKNRIKYLGKLTSEKASTIKLALRAFNGEELLLLNFSDLSHTESKKFLDVALLSSVYDSLGLNDVFDIRSDKEVGTKEVSKILTLSRCLDPQANYKTVDWFKDSYLPNIMNVKSEKYNKDKIFRELINISKQRKFLQKKLAKLSKKHNRDDLELYFFDGTTSFFEGTTCELAEGGKDKTTGYQDKIILILLVTDRQGFPVCWEVFKGRASEKTEIKKIIKRMVADMNIREVTFCFDRGFRTETNLKLIEDSITSNSHYISALDKNQIDPIFNVDRFVEKSREKLITTLQKMHEEKKQKKKEQDGPKTILPVNGFSNLGKDRFYQDLGVINDKRYIVSFNMNIFEKETITRLNLIDMTRKDIADIQKDLLNAKGDRDYDALKKKINDMLFKRKLTNIIKYEVIPKTAIHKGDAVQTYGINYEVLRDEIVKASKYDGILVYITNHTKKVGTKYEVAASEIVNYYKNKYVIENAFRYIKSFADLRPFYVHLPEHVKAHVDICMLSYFINNHIYHKLLKIGMSLQQFYSIIKSYSRVCTLDSGTGQSRSLLKALSREVTIIIKALGASSVLSKNFLEKFKIQLS